MRKILPSDYFAAQDRLCEWFEDLKRVLGCSENADLGAVLRKAEARERKIEAYEEQQIVVAKWRGYRFWGDCYNAAIRELPEAKPVELIPAYYEIPAGWLRGPGKSWDKADKQLVKTHKVIRKALGVIEEQAESEGPDWAETMRSQLLRIFEASSDHLVFEARVTDFIYPEEDPATTWVPIAKEAAAELEKANDLPTTAVEELIAYAYEAEVKMTKKELESIEKSVYGGRRFFDYLLTAYLYEQSRVSGEELAKTAALVEKALGYWGCYDPVDNPSGCYTEENANDPLLPNLMKRVYEPSISVEQIGVACRVVYGLGEEANECFISHNEIAEAVRDAVKQPEPGKPLAPTAEN
jgi:hypothetical protein